MSGRLTLRGLLEVAQYLGLPSPALVEKDWYVVRALAAIHGVTAGPLKLVFGGGTALSRAYCLTRRMSEDIDLRIVADREPSREELRALRSMVTERLTGAGFEFDAANPTHRNSGNGSRYTVYHLPYPARAGGVGILRPEIKVETAVWPIRREPQTCSVRSFWAEAHGDAAEVPKIVCTCPTETLAEKFVALTRRAGEASTRTAAPRDRALVRHVYDLHVTRGSYDAEELVTLARTIVTGDAEAYGRKFPAYRDNPIRETIRAVASLAQDPNYGLQYKEFVQEMVYGDRPDFRAALRTVEELAEKMA